MGSGDAFGSGGRFQTCIWLGGGGQVLLVDCGATSLVALKAQGLDPNEVGAVAVAGDKVKVSFLQKIVFDAAHDGRGISVTDFGDDNSDGKAALSA